MKSITSLAFNVSRNSLFLVGCCILAICAVEVRAELKNEQARKLITRMAGLELPSGAVRIKTISHSSAVVAEVAAEIKTVFRFEKDNAGQWSVREFRTGQDRWLPINLVANALNAKAPVDECSAPDPQLKDSATAAPSVRRARCLLANLLGVVLPSDSVRIQEVSALGVPMASQPSAIVTALITINVRATNEGGKAWRATDLRAGSSEWVKLDALAASIDSERKEQARGELAWMAEALEKFRKDRGFYVVSDSQAVVMDHLSPKYLPRIIRVDPWQRPYQYEGERERFVLSSVGADGKENTADDISISQSGKPGA